MNRSPLGILALALCACGQGQQPVAQVPAPVAVQTTAPLAPLMPSLACVQAHVDAHDAWAYALADWLQANPIAPAQAGGFYAVLDGLCVRAPQYAPVELFNAALRATSPPVAAAIVDPWKPGEPNVFDQFDGQPPATVDSSQTDRNNALLAQAWAQDKAQMAENERALQLRQQLAENSRQQQRAYTEAALLSRQSQETAVYNNVTISDPYAAPHRDYDSGTRIIRDANSMPNVTTVQVAPDRVWDYSTGQYHWADEQADGSLRVREGE
jgi:hypothetical protein